STSTTTSLKDSTRSTSPPSRCSTTPRPPPVPTTPTTCSIDSPNSSPATAKEAIADAHERRHQLRTRDRLRADRHRPSVRIRLLGNPGVPRTPRGGHPRHPHQLEPGDD